MVSSRMLKVAYKLIRNPWTGSCTCMFNYGELEKKNSSFLYKNNTYYMKDSFLSNI